MSPLQLKAHLGIQFEIVDQVDLATLSESPGSALKFFQSVYRTEYKENCRIVIYTDQCQIDDQLISHIYDASNFVDVSNWFVVFVTPSDISKQLAEVCALVSSDPVPFQNSVLAIEHCHPLKTTFFVPKTVCAVPWTHLEIQSNGSISACCKSTLIVGNISDISLGQAFHSQAMQAFRQEFMDGKKPTVCNNCWREETRGLTSTRQHNTKRLKEAFLTNYIDKPKIATIDLKFQNTCNFKCRICSPKSSSLFADENRKHFGIEIPRSSQWSDSNKFIDEFNSLLSDLVNIDMYGGEPFLIKKFAQVLKTAVDTDVAKNIRLHYNSNGSVWPKEFIPYWPNFKQVDIHFSIDAVGSRFSLERGSTWEQVESNILQIKNLNLPNLSISIMPTVGAMNVYYVDEVIAWANKHNFQVFVNYAMHSGLSLKNLTAEAKAAIIDKHKNNSWPEMQNILQALQKIPDSDGRAFQKLTEYFDTVRNENFSKTHPEIAKAMGYVYNNTNDSL